MLLFEVVNQLIADTIYSTKILKRAYIQELIKKPVVSIEGK